MGWLEQQREKQKREAQSRKLASKFARGLDTPSGNPFGRWAQGVAQRTMHPLETLAGVARESMSNPTETALNWTNPIGGSLSGLAGIFAGKGAKTANLANLEIAQKLKQQGVPDELIWKKTGWTLDTPDKLPRFEIPDNAAKMDSYTNLRNKENAVYKSERDRIITEAGNNPTQEQKFHVKNLQEAINSGSYRGDIGNALDHPELYKTYEGMRETPFNWREIPQGEHGSYDPNSGIILAQGQFGDGAKSTTLHELQHAIQQREGFARGGSPEQFRNVKEINRTKELADNVASVASHKFDQLPDELKQYARAINRGDDIGGEAYAKIAAHPQAKALWADYVQAQSQVKELLGGAQQIDMLTPTEQYQRLAGEAEARLTQARMNMTPEQRLAQYPYEPQYFQQATGVPLRDLIVRTQ